MKNYQLIYDPNTKEKRFLFTNINIKELSEPLTLCREKPEEEEVIFNAKKKSEVIEYESEEYKKLKEKESCPLLLEDTEHRIYTGKLQDIGPSKNTYFAFINTESGLKVVPIKKWYRFSQKLQFENINADDFEYTVKNADIKNDSERYDDLSEEIDFDEKFDDDDGEEFNFSLREEKKLSKAGRKIKNLMENYDESKSEEVEEEVVVSHNKKSSSKSEEMPVLTKSGIQVLFSGNSISLKDLLRQIKSKYKLDSKEKMLVKQFIAESCDHETDISTGERILTLKK